MSLKHNDVRLVFKEYDEETMYYAHEKQINNGPTETLKARIRVKTSREIKRLWIRLALTHTYAR